MGKVQCHRCKNVFDERDDRLEVEEYDCDKTELNTAGKTWKYQCKKDCRVVELVTNSQYGYKHLAVMPDTKDFYQDVYYDEKLDKPTDKEIADNLWLSKTLYSDIAEQLKANGAKSVLEIGCGKGGLLKYLKAKDFSVFGVEPSRKACAHLLDSDIGHYEGEFIPFYRSMPHLYQYDAIILMNVLEHVSDPVGMVTLCRTILKEGGTLIVQVPNDFNRLQLATKKDPWWVIAPDHINYFDLNSLDKLLEVNGFYVDDYRSDFPLEMFILMGIDYLAFPEAGKQCHDMRVAFETKIPSELRNVMYYDFALNGLGRNIRITAVKDAAYAT